MKHVKHLSTVFFFRHSDVFCLDFHSNPILISILDLPEKFMKFLSSYHLKRLA